MNTLSRTITASFFGNEESYEALRTRWSELCNSKEKQSLTVAHHMLYAALMGRDWRKGFCGVGADGGFVLPITNAKKLENGGDLNWGAIRAIRLISSKYKADIDALTAPFAGIVTAEMVCQVSKLLPVTSYYKVFDLGMAYPGASALTLEVQE